MADFYQFLIPFNTKNNQTSIKASEKQPDMIYYNNYNNLIGLLPNPTDFFLWVWHKTVRHINPVIGRVERCRPKGLYAPKGAPVAGFVF